MRLLPTSSIAVVALVLGARLAAAQSVPAPAPPAFAPHPGDVVTTRIPALPEGARELELVLVPEGGAPIVLTAEQPAGVGQVTWRVPRTFAGRARLVLRVGGEHAEWRSAESPPFALAPPEPGDLVRLRTGRAGPQAWRESWSESPAALDGGPRRDQIAPADATVQASEAPAPPALSPPPCAPCAPPADAARRAVACSRPERARRPTFSPLRN